MALSSMIEIVSDFLQATSSESACFDKEHFVQVLLATYSQGMRSNQHTN